MKSLYTASTALLLLLSLVSLKSLAADQNSRVTNEEAALWEDAFDEEIPSKPKKQQNSKLNDPSSSNISGSWVGYYEYDMPKGQPAGMFNAVIRDVGDKFFISFLEPRNSQNEYAQWGSNTTAKRQGKYIEFTKVYVHNQDTQIQYNLSISHNGSIMDGTWKINDKVYGRAFFYRVNLQNLKNVRKEVIN